MNKINYIPEKIRERNVALFGFSFYSKRYSLQKIDNNNPSLAIKFYSALSCMGIEEDFSFKSLGVNDINWERKARDIIIYSFHILFRSNQIEIVKVTRINSWLSGLINGESYYFDIRSKKIETPDLFCNKLIAFTKEFRGTSFLSAPLLNITKEIIDEYAYSNGTEPAFIHNILDIYSSKISEMGISKEAKFFGLISKFEFKIEEQLKVEIRKEIAFIREDMKEMLKQNLDYKLFVKALAKNVEMEFASRKSTDSGD